MKAVEKYLPVLRNALDSYKNHHPHWRIEVLVSLIKWGLRSLQHYIEKDRAHEITWEQPFVELHYPVEWNWNAPRDRTIICGELLSGTITANNTADRETASKTLSEIMVRHHNAMALQDFTNHVWFEKHKNHFAPFLPVALCAELDAIHDKRERQEALEQVIRPFSIGAALIDFSDMELRAGARVPKKVTRQLANIDKMIDIKRIEFTGDINGRKIEMSLIFQIHPLIIDYAARKTFHPITVGLFIEPRRKRDVFVTTTPSDWPRKDRETLWDELLQEIDNLTDRLIPKTENQDSVILSVNAKLMVPATWWLPENRSAEIERIADGLSLAGALSQINVQQAGNRLEEYADDSCQVCGWIHDLAFTQIIIGNGEAISLGGILPDIVRLIHDAHRKGLNGLNTKDDGLLEACGGYRNPCKAFDDLNHRREYKLLFDTRRRGLISLRGVVGRNRNKSEANPE